MLTLDGKTMGLLNIFKKKSKKDESLDDRLVTQAADPSKLDSNKLDLDAQRLELKTEKMTGGEYKNKSPKKTEPKDAVSQGLSLKNPFVGK